MNRTSAPLRISFSTAPHREDAPVLSTSAAYRLRLLLAVMAGTVVVGLAVVAILLVIDATTAGPVASDGADWGAVY
jgi:hypothetical protein